MTRGNILLVWEPGVGKTYPVLSAAHYVDGPTLIVVPAHLRLQWLREAQKHAPLLPAVILEKTGEKIPQSVIDKHEIFICSYEYISTLARWKQLRVIKWGALAIDECHYITNLEANRTRALLGLKPEEKQGMVFGADVVWLLSGTPFTFPNEIYPILAAVFPGAIKRTGKQPGLMTAREWENEFCVVADKGDGFGVKVVDAKNIPELRARLKPYLDKQKLDLRDIGPLVVDTIPIKGTLRGLLRGTSQELINLYDMLVEVLTDDDIPDTEKLAVLEENSAAMAQLRHMIAVTKVSPTVEIVRNELFTGVKKLIVFGWHRKPLEALAHDLQAPLIYGGMGDRKKADALDEFINEDCPVLVGQISSIGTGTDGLQEVCHRSLFMEASWAYRENKQCLHRTYRTGQRHPCHSSFISLVGSLDEYVSRILKRNAEIVSRTLDGD